nr:PREDICTED: protein YIPF1 [Opisthocomus hoazin]
MSYAGGSCVPGSGLTRFRRGPSPATRLGAWYPCGANAPAEGRLPPGWQSLAGPRGAGSCGRLHPRHSGPQDTDPTGVSELLTWPWAARGAEREFLSHKNKDFGSLVIICLIIYLLAEFDDAANLLAANRDATTISIDEPGEIPKNKHGRLQEPGREEDDELLGTDDSDKTELLAGQKKSAPFWTFEYYQTFFDVDTYQVLDRIKGSVFPVPGKNFVRLYIRSNPDLYGPFWICATLVFTIAVSGNLSNFFIHLGKPTYHYVPEFRKVSIAATTIYAYAWLVPLALWGFLMWRNSKVMNIVSYSFLEIVCVYGYSLFIYIPTAILWIIPQKVVRWVLVMFSLCLSGSVLVMTFWPAVRDDNRRIALMTVGAVVLLHALLSVGCLAYFFDAPELEFPAPVIPAPIIPAHNGTTVITTSQ